MHSRNVVDACTFLLKRSCGSVVSWSFHSDFNIFKKDFVPFHSVFLHIVPIAPELEGLEYLPIAPGVLRKRFEENLFV